MSIGHQIGDKSHTIGKSFNAKTSEEMDTHDFINLDEGRRASVVLMHACRYPNKTYINLSQVHCSK